jgi:21S rRNA (GM2251-2'-O)-methyltransferase
MLKVFPNFAKDVIATRHTFLLSKPQLRCASTKSAIKKGIRKSLRASPRASGRSEGYSAGDSESFGRKQWEEKKLWEGKKPREEKKTWQTEREKAPWAERSDPARLARPRDTQRGRLSSDFKEKSQFSQSRQGGDSGPDYPSRGRDQSSGYKRKDYTKYRPREPRRTEDERDLKYGSFKGRNDTSTRDGTGDFSKSWSQVRGNERGSTPYGSEGIKKFDRPRRDDGEEARYDGSRSVRGPARDLGEVERPRFRRREEGEGRRDNGDRAARAPRRDSEQADRSSFGRYELRSTPFEKRTYNTPHRFRNDSVDKEEHVRPIKDPTPIPYTSPSSEFLYGTSVVLSALRSGRRKLHKLYIYQSEGRQGLEEDRKISKLALAQGVQTSFLKGDEIKLLDRLSQGRPHNGYILEASPLPKLPAVSLMPVLGKQAPFQVVLAHQSKEEVAINGDSPLIPSQDRHNRYPFLLMLDGILDPGNLGAIMRSAYFFGVDAVVISNHSAPIGPVALKAAAGAAEQIPVISVHSTGRFITESQEAGWVFYAAVASPLGGVPSPSASGNKQQHVSSKKLEFPTLAYPTVLMLGSEGMGLQRDLQRKAQYTVSIEGSRLDDNVIDSLNVSVAAGVLCEAFLEQPSRQVLARRLEELVVAEESLARIDMNLKETLSPEIEPVSSEGNGSGSDQDVDRVEEGRQGEKHSGSDLF